MSRISVIMALGLAACADNKGGGGGCESNADCDAGSVCQSGACVILCQNDLACPPDQVCTDNLCAPCADCRQAPDVTSIEATGSADADPSKPNRLRSSLILRGSNLEGVAVTLTGGSFTNELLAQCGPGAADRVEVELPSDPGQEIGPGDYALTVANQAGTCSLTTQLVQGEPGSYVIGSGLIDSSGTLSVDFGSGATQAATGNHTHTGFLPTSGGTLSGDLLLGSGAHLGIGAQSPPALLHVQGSRAAELNSDPTAAMLSNSGLTLSTGIAAIVDDNVSVNAWHTDTSPLGSWLQVDLGTGVTREFVKARIYASVAGYAGRYDIEYSDNASTWLKARTGFIPNALGWNQAGWQGAGAHRYWRLYLANAPGGGPWLNELELYERGAGAALSVADDGVTTSDTVRARNVAKAWVSFDGQSVVIKGGVGVAGVVRAAGNAAGVYKITWSTPFADSSYVVTGACNALNFNGAHLTIEHDGTGDTRITPTSIAVGCRRWDNAYTNSDYVHVIAYGEQ